MLPSGKISPNLVTLITAKLTRFWPHQIRLIEAGPNKQMLFYKSRSFVLCFLLNIHESVEADPTRKGQFRLKKTAKVSGR